MLGNMTGGAGFSGEAGPIDAGRTRNSAMASGMRTAGGAGRSPAKGKEFSYFLHRSVRYSGKHATERCLPRPPENLPKAREINLIIRA